MINDFNDISQIKQAGFVNAFHNQIKHWDNPEKL